jgi:hypothetical protein
MTLKHVYALAFTTGSRSTAKKELFIPANDSVTQTIKVSPVRLVISMSIGLILLLAVMYLSTCTLVMLHIYILTIT